MATTADEQSPKSTSSYVSVVGETAKWAAGAIGAVGAAAVTKLSLDRLGKGDLHVALMVWAYVGLVAFTLGVVTIVGAVVWQARASRVTLGYILSDKYVAKKICEFLNANVYLLGGAQDLATLRARLNQLVRTNRAQRTPDEKVELTRLLDARLTVLDTARSERIRIVSGWATALIVAGTVFATLGAATFALSTNRDATLREDRIAADTLTSGELAPKTPSEITLAVPKARRAALLPRVGEKCDLGKAAGTLLEISPPPPGAVPNNLGGNFHIVTKRTDKCAVVNLWVPSRWLFQAATQGSASTTPTTASAGT